MKNFKDISAGIFRSAKDGICYIKLAEPHNEFNAVMVSSGLFYAFADEDKVFDF